MRYRREIDGLRAVAVIPVILFHAGLSVFGGGYVGVDVFFVISGYLITSILISERENGSYSIWHFYERRARRILPALFVVMAACVPLAWLRMPPYMMEDFARSMAFAALFLSNVHFWEKTGYFALDAEMQPLLHTWSLAVEEQFYLLFPLVLICLGAFKKNRYFLVFLILAVLSLLLSEWGWRNHPEENFFFTFSRFWELLAGSICAVILSGRSVMRNDFLGLLGLGLIIFAVFVFDDVIPFPSVYTLVPVVGTVLIILFAGDGTLTARLLSFSPLVGIGLISYSAYLWHQPAFAFARLWTLGHPAPEVMAGLVFVSLGLAWLTWRFVELPFRNREMPLFPQRRTLFLTSAAGIFLFAVIGAVGMGTQGFKSRMDRSAAPIFEAMMEDISKGGNLGNCTVKDDGTFGISSLCHAFGKKDAPFSLAVLGDSHGLAALSAFEHVSEKLGAKVLAAALPACPPLLNGVSKNRLVDSGRCRELVKQHAEAVVDSGVSAVVLFGRWSLYGGGGYDGPNLRFAMHIPGLEPPQNANDALETLRVSFERTVAYYRQAGVAVFVVQQLPEQKAIPQFVLERVLLSGAPKDEALQAMQSTFLSAADHEAMQGPVRDMILGLEENGVHVVSLDKPFLQGDALRWFGNNRIFYKDSDHILPNGAALIAPVLTQTLQRHLRFQ
ncbi:acyltransferase family protein [uncultured Roseovarius sp.]|uniref:acyltransferase family protein n=1 Tax=uncultured Roseovarius sp. TaxID=293344 RepID=UPI0025ED1EFA|nr:acyltransferase family protein [uncultured Roseovarius sp.]